LKEFAEQAFFMPKTKTVPKVAPKVIVKAKKQSKHNTRKVQYEQSDQEPATEIRTGDGQSGPEQNDLLQQEPDLITLVNPA